MSESKWRVYKCHCADCTWHGTQWLAMSIRGSLPFRTWSEAYDYADRMARTNQGENND